MLYPAAFELEQPPLLASEPSQSLIWRAPECEPHALHAPRPSVVRASLRAHPMWCIRHF